MVSRSTISASVTSKFYITKINKIRTKFSRHCNWMISAERIFSKTPWNLDCRRGCQGGSFGTPCWTCFRQLIQWRSETRISLSSLYFYLFWLLWPQSHAIQAIFCYFSTYRTFQFAIRERSGVIYWFGNIDFFTSHLMRWINFENLSFIIFVDIVCTHINNILFFSKNKKLLFPLLSFLILNQ